MIGTVETKKIVVIELQRSEVHNILSGAELGGALQVRHDKQDVPMEVRIFCSNPESEDEGDNDEC